MGTQKLTRRRFLRWVGVAASAAALGACTPEPIVTAIVTATPGTVPTPAERLAITIVYNNIPFDGRLITAWGFSALIEIGERRLLFDTGGDAPTLLGNMEVLGIDPLSIETVILSHIHGDHVGGLEGLLAPGIRPTVYVPPSFPSSFKEQVRAVTELVETEPGQAIVEGMFTTGEMPTPGAPDLFEQSLTIPTAQGLVVVTGCAHPGIVAIAERAQELLDEPVYLVLGGFHLDGLSTVQLQRILVSLRELGVEKVSPSHCTGDRAIAQFAEEYGSDFIQCGAGSILSIAA